MMDARRTCVGVAAFAVSLFGWAVSCEAQQVSKEVATAIRGSWRGTQSGDEPFDKFCPYGTFNVIITESTVDRRWKLPVGAVPGSAVMRGTNVSLDEEKDSGGQIWEIEKYTYILQTDRSPIRIDLTAVDATGKKWVFNGIVDLQSDRLAICYDMPGSARPTGFPKTPGGTTLWTLQREKKVQGGAGRAIDPQR